MGPPLKKGFLCHCCASDHGSARVPFPPPPRGRGLSLVAMRPSARLLSPAILAGAATPRSHARESFSFELQQNIAVDTSPSSMTWSLVLLYLLKEEFKRYPVRLASRALRRRWRCCDAAPDSGARRRPASTTAHRAAIRSSRYPPRLGLEDWIPLMSACGVFAACTALHKLRHLE